MNVQLMVLMKALDHQKISLISILPKQAWNFGWVYIITLIIVIWLTILTGKEIFKFKADHKNFQLSTFQLDFV